MSNRATGSSLSNVYEDHIGEVSTKDEARGYWLFALGVILGTAGILMFFSSQGTGDIRLWSGVLAAAGLVLLIAGPIIRLPLWPIATLFVYAGALISAVAIVLFVVAYPGGWSPQTGNLTVIGLYALGVLVVAASGAFVPTMTDREDLEVQVSALQEGIDEQQEALDGAEETEAKSAELERKIDQLHDDIADTKADEAELAALLTEHRTSESQFEVYQDRGGAWRWRLRHRNGNTLASSGEGYTSRSGVWDGIESVNRNAPDAEFTETDG